MQQPAGVQIQVTKSKKKQKTDWRMEKPHYLGTERLLPAVILIYLRKTSNCTADSSNYRKRSSRKIKTMHENMK